MNEYVTHFWHSFQAVPASVSTSHEATQRVVHPHTITSTRDIMYQVHNKYGILWWTCAVLVPGTLVCGTMSMHCDCTTHVCHSFHAVPVPVSTSHTATQHVVHPRTIASTRNTRYQSAHRTQRHHTSYTDTRYHPREIPDTGYIQVGYPLVKLSQVVSYTAMV